MSLAQLEACLKSCPFTPPRILIESGALAQCGPWLNTSLPPGPWLLVADQTTWDLAGPQVTDSLRRSQNIAGPTYIIAPEQSAPHASQHHVDALCHTLQTHTPRLSAAIALGSGTINDLVKLAAFQAELPYVIIATAPSMNGYTSSIAAILTDGVKTTQPCRGPAACLIDLDLVAEAPYSLIAAGLGDLVSKPVSSADWYLSHQLMGTPYSEAGQTLIEEAARLVEDIAAKLPQRDPDALARLYAGLLVSGLAMAVAGSSAPASGGEHLISHYLDMNHFAHGTPYHLHGCQVGVATLYTAGLYQRLLKLDPTDIDLEQLVDAHPPWSEYAPQLQERFGTLTPAILPHARQGFPTREQLRQRLTLLKENWHSISGGLRQRLSHKRQTQVQLEQAECPTSFAALGIDLNQAHRAALYSKDIRARYTILDLAAELGRLESWTGELLDSPPTA